MTPWAALLIGVLGATASFWTVQAKRRLRADDALDVFACHGIAGIVGALLTGALAWTTGSGQAVGPQLLMQGASVAASVALSGLGTLLLLRLVGHLTPLRVSPRQEVGGMDLSAHSEQGYREPDGRLGSPVVLGGD